MPLPTTQNRYAIELAEDEQIEYVARHHWMLLLYRMAIPLLIILVVGGLVAYRWFGGQFFVFRSGPRGIIDPANVLLLVGAALALFGVATGFRRKERTMMAVYTVAAAACLALFAFRYQGGRVFVLNPFEATGVDLFNRIALGIALLMLLVCAYILVDWRNDALVLTSRRVVHDRRDLLQRHVQDQIVIEKIESVKAPKNTYMTYWLDYGTIVVQATTVGRRIVLEMADEPDKMKELISAKLKKLKDSKTEAQFAQMIDQHVYGEKQRKARPPLKLRVYQSPSLLNWLFFDNPEVNDEKGEVIWYPHWIFVFGSVALPFVIFMIGVVLLLLSIRVSFLIGSWALGVGFILLLICSAWGAWRYKDTIDDQLEVTPNSIIKIDKMPFGPEKRRSASIGAIKNVAFHSTFIGRLIGYGTIEVQTGSLDTSITMKYLPDPREIVSTIYEYMVEYKASERERTLNDTLALMHHFHRVQEDYGELFKDEQPPVPQQAT